jgi:hypothetical protein
VAVVDAHLVVKHKDADHLVVVVAISVAVAHVAGVDKYTTLSIFHRYRTISHESLVVAMAMA